MASFTAAKKGIFNGLRHLGQRVERRLVGVGGLPLHLCVRRAHASARAVLGSLSIGNIAVADPAHRALRLGGREHGAPAV